MNATDLKADNKHAAAIESAANVKTRLGRARFEDAERRAAGLPTLMTLDEINAEVFATLARLIDKGTGPVRKAAIAQAKAAPKITLNGRFTRRMGDANSGRNRLRFSKPLWERAGFAQRLDTVRHEVAHLVANRIAARAGHGPVWRAVAACAECSADRCHAVPNVDLKRRQPGSIIVTCGCPGVTHSLGARRAARLRNKQASYRCPKCRQDVKETR